MAIHHKYLFSQTDKYIHNFQINITPVHEMVRWRMYGNCLTNLMTIYLASIYTSAIGPGDLGPGIPGIQSSLLDSSALESSSATSSRDGLSLTHNLADAQVLLEAKAPY